MTSLSSRHTPENTLILVVDDLSDNLKVIGNILDRAGYATTFAQSGRQALERIREAKPQLVLLDLMMPVMSGLEVCEQLRHDPDYHQLPVIFLTASHEREHLLEAFAAGAVDYITKPFNPPELLARVQTHLDLHHSREQLNHLVSHIQQLNADLEETVSQRTTELRRSLAFEATLKRITEKIRDSLDEGQIVQVAVREIVLALKLNVCNAGIYNLQQQTSTVTYEYAPLMPPTSGQTYSFSDFPELYQHLLNGQHTQFCWHPLYFQEQCEVALDYTRTSVLICAIQDDRGVLGDLWSYKGSREPFTESEVRLIQQVAIQCAIAIRQARLYRAAQNQVYELERLNSLKNDFLSTISHELRTPMANIEMVSAMLATLFERLSLEAAQQQQIQKYFDVLHSECRRELGLINDLLDLVRLDAETEPMLLEPIDLRLFIPHVTEPFVRQIQHQSLRLNLILPATLPMLTSDSTILKRIFTELLTNACKYTPEGGFIEIEAFMVTATADDSIAQPVAASQSEGRLLGDRIQINVSNSGVDLPPVELSRIFDTFYRVPNHDPWRHGGTGLGLALVSKQMHHLGGRLWANCKAGKFTLTLQLPLRRSALKSTSGGSAAGASTVLQTDWQEIQAFHVPHIPIHTAQ